MTHAIIIQSYACCPSISLTILTLVSRLTVFIKHFLVDSDGLLTHAVIVTALDTEEDQRLLTTEQVASGAFYAGTLTVLPSYHRHSSNFLYG